MLKPIQRISGGVLLAAVLACTAPTAQAQGNLASRLAPQGQLRVGLIGSNAILIQRGADGKLSGIAVELAGRLAAQLGVPLRMIPYETAALYAASLGKAEWDIVMSGRDPSRSEFIAFSDPYLEIDSLYLARPGLELKSAEEVDRPDIRIVVYEGGSQDNYLTRELKHASLLRVRTPAAAREALASGRADVLGATSTGVYKMAADYAGTTVLSGRFSVVQQAIGVPKANADLLPFINGFLLEAKRSGMVADEIRREGLQGVHPAP